MAATKTYRPGNIDQDIVISGMSGRFPESDSVDEFADNLYNKVDMITLDSRRWPQDLYGINNRMGKIKDINKFDGEFFGIAQSMSNTVDPYSRILLETTYEAILDAGINPQSLRGSNTGVYIGYSSFGMPDGVPGEVQIDSQNHMADTLLWVQGSNKCCYANRVSFLLDFKGPSFIIDTACSSSLVAFNCAMNDILLGKCDQAIVGGTHLNLQPFTNHVFQATHLNAPDGIPKVWDEKADGYVRGESVACVFLQKRSDSKRVYATVLNSGVNIDGYKKMGMFFPSSETQEELMCRVYEEAKIDPLQVNYFEAHATGTKVGDPEEAKAIFNAYCAKPKREGILPIGLLKSNIGHTEAASGVSAIIKVLLAFEKQCIPPCLHLDNIKSTIKEYCPPFLPVTENYPYTPGIAGVNNFGVGGVNAHVLLEPNYKTKSEDNEKIADTIPRLIHICARTEEAFNFLINWIQENPKKITRDFLILLSETMKFELTLKTRGFSVRGSIIIKDRINEKGQIQRECIKHSSLFTDKTHRQVWFVFPGLGGQWVGMAKALMPIKIFADKIEECHEVLKPYGIDLKYLLLSDDKNSMSSMTNKFCATTAIEIALMDIMTALNIIPDGIIGHSFGEIAAAYADGCLTTQEALLVTYYRGVVTESDKKIPKGLMAVVGLSWTEAKRLCPKGTNVVCNNGKDTVVVSGLYNETKQMVEDLNKKGVFVRELQSHDIPYHSKYLITSTKKLTEELKKCIVNPKPRSKNWLSTALTDEDIDDVFKLGSAEYFVHNLISPVFFYNKLKNIPMDAIMVEIGPHGLFSKIISETLDSSTYISLIKKNSNDTNLDMFLGSISKMYEIGLNPSIDCLYPKVEYPVSRGTQSVSSLLKWDHSENYFVQKWPHFHFKATASEMTENINFHQRNKTYLDDHCIDGNVLFPATGFLMCAWRQLAAHKGRSWNQLPVIFEDVQLIRAVFISPGEPITLKIKYFEQTGDFVVSESGNTVCVGKVRSSDETPLCVQSLLNDVPKDKTTLLEMKSDDIYKEMRAMGYDYGPMFRGMRRIETDDWQTMRGEVEWDGNWVRYVDALFQTTITATAFRKMMVPVMIKQLRCDPKVLYEAVVKHKLIDDENELPEEIRQIKEELEEEFGEKSEKTQYIPVVFDTEEADSLKEVMGMFHIYKSVIPFCLDLNSRMIVAPGIEVEDIIAYPFPRKFNIQDLRLESYEFLANEDYNSIEEFDEKRLLEYLKVCSTIAHRLNKAFKGAKNEQSNSVESQEFIEKYINDLKDEHVLLKVLNEIQKQTLDENQNLIDIKINEVVTQMLAKPENDLSKDVLNIVATNERLIRSLLDIVSENNVPKKEIKVFEINLTNGLMAEEIDNYMASAAMYTIEVDYNIAVNPNNDINEEIKKKSFKINEWDFLKSNFPLDISMADLVIVKDSPELWNLKMETFIEELYDCIIENGFVILVFRYKMTEPEKVLNKIMGREVSDQQMVHRINEFKREAESVGFSIVGTKCDSIGSMALLFRKVETRKPVIPKKNNVIEITAETTEWFDKLQQILLKNKDNDKKENIWLIAQVSFNNGIIGLINCLRVEPGGETMRCIFDCDNNFKIPINFKETPFSDILVNNLAVNVIKNGKLGTYRHLTLPKDYDQTLSDEYYLNTSHKRDLSSLQWFSLKNMGTKTVRYDLKSRKCDLVKVNIYSAGLNFKDVMLSTGRITVNPLSLFTDCSIGFEFAGRRTDTGERVFGFDVSRCFATSIDAIEDILIPIPENWSMDDAVTILITYSTLWYGLIERAHMERGESILIHSGAGGIGQAAINMCQKYDCDIFVTVGNEEKKKFLMTEYNIPENRIFSSRDIQFKFKIKALTKGKGVDIVLNSLTGDKLEASYECVADCGRFVEIGKYDLQMNKQLGMFSFLRDISFIGISADMKLSTDRNFMKRFKQWIQMNCNNGMIKPITRTVFKAEDAEKAFRYMTTGKHIGKIILKMREEENQNIAVNGYTPSPLLKVTTKTYFDENKVYIIIGGLSDFALEILNWMLHLGARKFVLTSRYGIKSDYQKYFLERLRSLGVTLQMYKTDVIVSTHNTFTIDGTKALIEESNKLGQIGGIFHLAVVYNDSLIEKHNLDKFNETVDTKVKIFENLDKITRDLKLDLDYFVVFSSVSCSKGNAGQTSYGYANSVCERICEQRKRDGLNGLAIQWGPVADVGFVADTEMNVMAGMVKQRVNSCLEILDKLLQSQKPVVSCVMRAKRVVISGTKESRIIGQIWQALGIDPKTTPDHMTLGEIGMESMFAMELQQGLEKDYKIKISLNDVKSITVRLLKDFEAGKIEDMRHFAEEIRECRNKLSKFKFIIPNDATTQLNSVTSGKPVYFLPPLEGIFSSLDPLVEKIDRPVIGLNWLKDMDELKSLKEITKYYMDLLKSIHPKGDYDIVGYFSGALIATQMLKKKAPIGRVVIIDILSDLKIDEDILSDDSIFTLIAGIMTKDMPQVVKDKVKRTSALKPDINSKLIKIGEDLKEFVGKSLVSRDLEEILINSFKRAKLFTNFRYKMKNKLKQLKLDIGRRYLEMNGRLLVIKPLEFVGNQLNDENVVQRIKSAYFLPEKGLEGKVNFETIDANPEAISSMAFDKIANSINHYFKK